MRELRQVPHAEAKKEPGFMIREANVHPGGGIGGCAQNVRSLHAGEHGPVLWFGRTADDFSCAKVMRLVREPDAGDRPVRFDEEDVETE